MRGTLVRCLPAQPSQPVIRVDAAAAAVQPPDGRGIIVYRRYNYCYYAMPAISIIPNHHPNNIERKPRIYYRTRIFFL